MFCVIFKRYRKIIPTPSTIRIDLSKMGSLDLTERIESNRPVRVLELFAGIGGWRLALPKCYEDAEVVAYDSGPYCTEIYQRNFGDECKRKNIEQLTNKDLDNFDVWLMSPPCQPFTRQQTSKELDVEDNRCKALEHLCAKLQTIDNPPGKIMLENVKGFRHSSALEMMKESLKSRGYTWKEFLIDPAICGMPNHRTRYYLMATRSDRFTMDGNEGALYELRSIDESKCFNEKNSNLSTLRITGCLEIVKIVDRAHDVVRQAKEKDKENVAYHSDFKEQIYKDMRNVVGMRLMQNIVDHVSGFDGKTFLQEWCAASIKLLPADSDAIELHFDAPPSPALEDAFRSLIDSDIPDMPFTITQDVCRSTARPVGEFLDKEMTEPYKANLMITRAVLSKSYAKGLSVVAAGDQRTFCFTGHYGKVMNKSSGSLYLEGCPDDYSIQHSPIDKGDMEHFYGRLRLFSPKEVLNMLGFPAWYEVPKLGEMRLSHQYKAVGNSVSVHVCKALLDILFFGDSPEYTCKFEIAVSKTEREIEKKQAAVITGELDLVNNKVISEHEINFATLPILQFCKDVIVSKEQLSDITKTLDTVSSFKSSNGKTPQQGDWKKSQAGERSYFGPEVHVGRKNIRVGHFNGFPEPVLNLSKILNYISEAITRGKSQRVDAVTMIRHHGQREAVLENKWPWGLSSIVCCVGTCKLLLRREDVELSINIPAGSILRIEDRPGHVPWKRVLAAGSEFRGVEAKCFMKDLAEAHPDLKDKIENVQTAAQELI